VITGQDFHGKEIQSATTGTDITTKELYGYDSFAPPELRVSAAPASPEVAILPRLLKATAMPGKLLVPGEFDQSTTDAINSFQGSHGISGTGLVGASTWQMLATTAGQPALLLIFLSQVPSLLGQTANGTVDVADDHVRLEVQLPWMLALLANTAKGIVQKQAKIMLEKPTKPSKPA
jgi:hypothetical protein